MAAVLKKRALAQYSQAVNQDESSQYHFHHKAKKLRLSRKSKREGHKEKAQVGEKEGQQTSGSLDELTLIVRASNREGSAPHQIIKLFVKTLDQRMPSLSVQQLYKKLLLHILEQKEGIVKASLIGVIKRLVADNRLQKELDVPVILEDILTMLSAPSEANIVKAECLDTIHKIYQLYPMLLTSHLNQKVIACVKHLLSSCTNHLVKRQCLMLLADLAPVAPETSLPSSSSTTFVVPTTPIAGDNVLVSGQIQTECISIIKLLRDFSHYFDSRVRSAALSSILRLHDRGVNLDISLYSEFCEALSDDYEGCRMSACKLLEVLSHLYGDCLVCVSSGDEQIRLVDDAFAKVCSMISDLSIKVRTKAASLLGKFTNVSPNFLEQTLDKKLMSNLRKKKSAHERSLDNYKAGEWSSGKKWADDAPQEAVCPEEVNLMDIGACGAIVHGLEDEFLEVRMATLESLCELAKCFPGFANLSLDFLVDMFNDEIEDIRLKAIHCLSQISQQSIILREDQIEIILAALEDSSVDIREALHEMLGNCKVSSKSALKSCVDNLLDNLRKYPQDKDSVWNTFKKLGINHPFLTSPLVPELLGIHPFLDLPEPSLEDSAYIGILILVFNAAENFAPIVALFEHHTYQHYSYLRDSFPNLVPSIREMTVDRREDIVLSSGSFGGSRSAQTFLFKIFERIRNSISSERIEVQSSVIELSIRDLQRLGEIESSMSSACDFLKQYLACQMSLRKILVNNNWINAFLLSALQSSLFRSSLQQILQTTFRLNHQFHGIHPLQSALIQQTRVKALALQLQAIIHGSNASALALCDAFLEEMEFLEKHLEEHRIKPDLLTEAMMREINSLEEPKPGSVARVLQPLFLSCPKLVSQLADLSSMVCEETLSSLVALKMSTAVINEPTGKSETPLKFTAGLILCIKLDAVIRNITDIRHVRIKIKYPDQQAHLVLPKLNDFRQMDAGSSDQTLVKNYRLYTNVYLSHSVWSEPCHVEIGVTLDFRESSSTALSVSQQWASKTGSYMGVKSKTEENLLIELCRPVRVYVAPKPHKKGIM